MTVTPRVHGHAHFTGIIERVEPQTPIPTLRALLIGINAYKHFTQLSGAVNDAESIYNFLRCDLSVPDSRITKLNNEQATRSSIINALEALSKDASINRFDPILIFYAGHGCEVDSPLANYREKAQCLVPWDLGDEGADGQRISPIPDYTIAALLNELATEKGNNITVIFDSCHSASSTRGIRRTAAKAESGSQYSYPQGVTTRLPSSEPGRDLASNCRARSLNAQDLPPLTLETDKAIIRRAHRRRQWRTIIVLVRSHLLFLRVRTTMPEANEIEPRVATPEPLINRGTPKLLGFFRSHVLLAACGHSEHAYECAECKCGYFTSVLLQVLRSRRLRKLKYKRCFEEFPKLLTPSSQNPVCEGNTTSRVFFDITAKLVTERTVSFTMQQLNDGYFLRLGDAQGVSPGAKYGIYEDYTFPKGFASGPLPSPGRDRPLWGSFKAYPCMGLEPTLYPFYSWCELDIDARLPIWPRAKLLKLGLRGPASLKVFVSDALKLILDPNTIVVAKQGMMLVDSVDLGTVILDVDHGHSGCMTFRLAGFSGQLYSCYPDAARVHSVLISMAQWNWHWSRAPQDTFSHNPMAQLIVYELGKPTPLPTEVDGSTSVKVSPTALYALKVKSLSSKRLYPYLFYFSTARQSIRPLYLGIYGSGHIDTSLEPNGELTFGYNNDDMIPGALSFSIAPDEGYFQLFLTTSPGDFDSLAQSSPFTESEPCHYATDDGYGDGLEIRRFPSSGSDETSLKSLPTTPSNAFFGHSADIVAAQVFGISMSERQQTDIYRGLEHSMRKVLPESAVLELINKHHTKSQTSLWGVVSLKVTCKPSDGL